LKQIIGAAHVARSPEKGGKSPPFRWPVRVSSAAVGFVGAAGHDGDGDGDGDGDAYGDGWRQCWPVAPCPLGSNKQVQWAAAVSPQRLLLGGACGENSVGLRPVQPALARRSGRTTARRLAAALAWLLTMLLLLLRTHRDIGQRDAAALQQRSE
jgi:hypothetical protein